MAYSPLEFTDQIVVVIGGMLWVKGSLTRATDLGLAGF